MNTFKGREAISVGLVLLLFLSVSAWAAEMTLLSEATYAEGTYDVSSISIPTGYTKGYIKLLRVAWLNPASRVEWHAWVSQDAGATWDEPHAAGAANGGTLINPRTGLPAEYSTIGFPLPQPDNADRRVKAVVIVSGDQVTTTIYGRLE